VDNLKYLENYSRYKDSERAMSFIDCFFDLLLVNGISLGDVCPIETSIALRKGFVLSNFNKDVYSERLFKKLSAQFAKNKEFNAKDFSELSTLALLKSLGAKEADFVKTNMVPSHDFNVSFGSSMIEVETTRPSVKEEFVIREQQAASISQFALSLKKYFDIKIYIVDLLSTSEMEELKNTLKDIREGEIINKEKVLYVYTEIPNRGIYEVFKNVNDEKKPDWWPNEIISGFQLAATLAGPDAETAPPQASVTFGCPFKGYENRPMNKATNFQGTRTKPYLLVVDANELANPFVEFRKVFERFLPQWPHISGAIVYMDHWSMNSVGWELEVFVNNNATRPFQKDVIDSFGNFTTRMRVAAEYAKNEL
jgi:hypothetical protein